MSDAPVFTPEQEARIREILAADALSVVRAILEQRTSQALAEATRLKRVVR